MTEFIRAVGPTIIYVFLVALFGYLGRVARRLAEKYLDDETKRNIAESVVSFVEQVYKSLHGEDKLAKAMESAAGLLSEKGISCSSEELRVLIEAAVFEFNSQLKPPDGPSEAAEG